MVIFIAATDATVVWNVSKRSSGMGEIQTRILRLFKNWFGPNTRKAITCCRSFFRMENKRDTGELAFLFGGAEDFFITAL